MQRPPLRFGIAGLGLASTFMLPYLARDPRVKITAAADVRPAAREQFAREFQAATFASVEDLCRSPQVDVVYVCTPNYLHAEHAIQAATYGKHILLEKPMAVTLEECDAIIAAAERHGVHLIYGHTHSYDPPIQKLWEVVRSGALGRLTMLHTWNYTDLLYRPRAAWELDTQRGGGVVYIQAPHQVDIVRLLGGGLVGSVRAMTGCWDPALPTEGAYAAYLEFADGVPATLVYSGYGHFDTAELHYWIGERGLPRDPATHAQTWAAYRARAAAGAADPDAGKDAVRYGGDRPRAPAAGPRHQYFFGLTLVSCERGDLRQSPDGIYVYDETGKRELPLPPDVTGNQAVIDAVYDAVVHDRPPLHDGRWGKATLEVCLAILESARQRRELLLAHQVPSPA